MRPRNSFMRDTADSTTASERARSSRAVDSSASAVLLKEQGYTLGVPTAVGDGQALTNATTILAFKYRDGVLVAGDRRATAGNMVMYDRTDKVLEIDRHSVMAIAGVPATAYEMVRVLEHSFKYYRRTQLQELSFDGKLRAVSQLLIENVPAALAGTGAVVPVFAGYDVEQGSAKIYFYDILGAEFEGAEYAVSGSGSPTIRGILHYLNTWGSQPLNVLPEEQAMVQALQPMQLLRSIFRRRASARNRRRTVFGICHWTSSRTSSRPGTRS